MRRRSYAFFYNIRLERVVKISFVCFVGLSLALLLAKGAFGGQTKQQEEEQISIAIEETERNALLSSFFGRWSQTFVKDGVLTGGEEKTFKNATVQKVGETPYGIGGLVTGFLMEELPLFTEHTGELVFLNTMGEAETGEMLVASEQAETQKQPTPAPLQPELGETEKLVKETLIKSNSGKVNGGAITLNNETTYDINIEELVKAPLSFAYQKEKIQVLIVHTHGTESYLKEDTGKYVEGTGFRSFEEGESVIAVGNAIETQLKAAGIGVIHDKTIHDYPSFNGSYENTKKTIASYLDKNSDISVVLDIHRDAMINDEKTVYKPTVVFEEQKYAQVMMVMGSNGGGLSHDYWQENLKLAFRLQEKLVAAIPNLARPLSLKKERYNQQMTKNSLLIEMGTCGNTLEEVLRSGTVVGKTLGEILTSSG